MQQRLKTLVEIASIELAYARAEVDLLDNLGEEKQRIAEHLSSACETLENLSSKIGDLELFEQIAAAYAKTCRQDPPREESCA